jgi:hypothetical protein
MTEAEQFPTVDAPGDHNVVSFRVGEAGRLLAGILAFAAIGAGLLAIAGGLDVVGVALVGLVQLVVVLAIVRTAGR